MQTSNKPMKNDLGAIITAKIRSDSVQQNSFYLEIPVNEDCLLNRFH